jgi:regulator of nonsense transcripts 1
MAEAFNSLGNHLVSDSTTAINTGDDLSTIDNDESVIGANGLANHIGGGARRRRGDDEEETDLYDDDDMESLISQPMNGGHKAGQKQEEEVELPPHACA